MNRLQFHAICFGSALICCCASTGAQAHVMDSAQAAPVYTALQRNAWYLPTDDQAAMLYVTEIGKGSPVVFLHGGPGNDFQYIIDALLPHLDEHRFILFDDRGSLLSPVAPDKVSTLTLTNLVADLETLRKATGQEKLVLFGHSFGSLLALAYYQAHPDHVDRLILSGAFPPAGALADILKPLHQRENALRTRPAVAETLHKEHLDGPDATLTVLQKSMRDRLLRLAVFNIVDLTHWREVVGGGVYYNSAVDSQIGSSLPTVLDFGKTILSHPVPITIIQGDMDYLDPAASKWQAWKAQHPRSPIRIHVMRHASHYSWIDDPNEFATSFRDAFRH